MFKLSKILFPIFAVFTVILLAASVVVTMSYAKSRYRQVQYYVVVQDDLYFQYKSSFEEDIIVPSEKKVSDSIKFISESDSFEFIKVADEGAIPVVAAEIVQEASFVLTSEDEVKSNQSRYIIEYKDILPTVEADFENPKSVSNSLLSPDLSVNLTSKDSIKEGWRALSIDGIYAGQENYPLRKETRITVTYYVEEVKKLIMDRSDACFIPISKEISVLKEELSSPVFIAAVGDVMVARGVQDILIGEENGLEKVFKDTLPILQNNDMTICNLEGAVTDNTKNATKTYTFKFNKKVLPYLKDAGFDYFMMTNNHCYDYGEAGFKDTLKAFEEYNISTSGIGADLEKASLFYHTKLGDLNVAVISVGAYPVERSGFNGKTTATATDKRAGILWQSQEVLDNVKKEKEQGNFVIVNVHGGEEYQFVPSKSQRDFYEDLCDYGADVVFGSHPHVVQPTEWYNGSLIVYSLGNFLFNGMEGMYKAEESEIVRLGILDGKIAYVEQYPAHLHETTVYLDKSRSLM